MGFTTSVAASLFVAAAVVIYPSSGDALTVQGAYVADSELDVSSTPAAALQFGASVAMSSGEMFIAQPGGGSADVYTPDAFGRGGWLLQDRVADEQPLIDAGAYLPCNALAIDGATAAVGVPSANGSRGKVVVYARSGTSWTLQQTLTESAGSAFDSFGCSVGLSGDTLVVGAPAAAMSGVGYVYHRSGTVWTLVSQLLPSDRTLGDQIGLSAAIDGNTIILGAPKKNSATGAAYLFTRAGSAWTQTAKLGAADGAIGDQFGATVAIDGGTALVGAPEHAGGEGEAYVFSRGSTTWTAQARFQSMSPVSAGYFGSAVAISGDRLIVGELGNAAVHIYRFIDGNWTFRAVAGERSMTHFGGAVALDGGTALVGAYSDGSFGRAFVLRDDTIFADGL